LRLPGQRETNRAAVEIGIWHLMSLTSADDFQRFSRPAPGIRGSGHCLPGQNVYAKRLFINVRAAVKTARPVHVPPGG